jgi:predicted lipoprotein with Yx(FWY)xxD motif
MNGSTTSSRTARRRAAVAIGVFSALAVGLAGAAADASYGPDPTPAPAPAAGTEPAAPETTAAAAPVGSEPASAASLIPENSIVGVAESSLGSILVDSAGMTLYAFQPDAAGESTCTGDCLTNWPAVPATAEDVSALEAAGFGTVENPEAGTMLTFGGWPLYYFAGDAAPGDVNGQAVGDVWWVVGPVTGAPANLVNTRESALGTVLVNAQGMTLYAFLNDTEGESTCTGDCLANWPAAVVGEADVSLLDPEVFTTVENPEAGTMLKAGDWPLYTFAGDAAPGDVNGQAVGDVWWVVAADGALIETPPAPAGTAPAGTATATTGG